MLSSLDAPDLVGNVPEGVAPGTDVAGLATGQLLGLDVAGRLAQVSVNGSEGIWVPAHPAIYPASGLVRLLRSPLDGGRVALCLGPLEAAPSIVAGTVDVVNSGTGTLDVTALDASWTLPYTAGTYAAGTLVHVLRDPQRFGEPAFVLGPQGNFSGSTPGTPGAGAGNPGQLANRQATILPQWSGSWRSSYSQWDRWNTDRYGGISTLYQGNGFGSGAMAGLAAYGDQVVNLGAVAITRMLVSVYRADASSSAGKVAVLQPSPHGARPPGSPAGSGATASSPALAPGQGAQVDLPSSVFEGFRTGASKGLVAVGGDYAGFSGTSRGDGMALIVQYQVIA